jgi:hypothetical protein
MASPNRRRRWLTRGAEGRPLLFVVGLTCAAAVIIEVAAFTGFFGLADQHTSPGGPAGPNLNPYHEKILAITSNITYFGSVTGYFPTLNGTSLCALACPELPRLWESNVSHLPPEIGIHFFYNVTNTAAVTVNLSVPVLQASGPDSTLFYLETFCCYTTVNQPYDEQVIAAVQFTSGTEIGFEGYAFTTATIPAAEAGGYTLYVNFTSN